MSNFWQKGFGAWAIALLLIFNISTLSLLWYKEINKPPRPVRGPANALDNRERMLRFIERELDLSKEQAREFRKLHSVYLQQSKALRDEIRDLKRNQLQVEMFTSKADTLKINQAARRIANKQFEFEKQTFLHFQKLKALIGEDQEESLKALLDEVFMKRGNSRPPRRGRSRPPNNGS
ncbi:MAG: periplasmic heavy metal sensor [Gemmatimonadota bacterium]|nr:periplasmic heavy metal sensor [Gemmatimonadota bacterium]